MTRLQWSYTENAVTLRICNLVIIYLVPSDLELGYDLLVETNPFLELVVIFRTSCMQFEHPSVLFRFCLNVIMLCEKTSETDFAEPRGDMVQL